MWTGAKRGIHGRTSFRGLHYNTHYLALLCNERRERPPEGMVCCHICNTGLCINPDHLEWGTRSKNTGEDRLRDGTLPFGGSHPRAKLSDEDVEKLRSLKFAMSVPDLAAKFGITEHYTYSILGYRARDGPKLEHREAAPKLVDRVLTDADIATFRTRIEEICDFVDVTDADRGTTDGLSPHWIPRLSPTTGGYTKMGIGIGRTVSTHKLALIVKLGRNLTAKEMAIHRCVNKPECCNPDHIELGDAKSNALIRRLHGTQQMGATHWRARTESPSLEAQIIEQLKEDSSIKRKRDIVAASGGKISRTYINQVIRRKGLETERAETEASSI